MNRNKIRAVLLAIILLVGTIMPVKAATTIYSSDTAVKAGNWIYYVNQSNLNLYRMKTDGSSVTRISTDKVNGEFFIKDSYIYYGTANSGSKKNYNYIYKINLTGTKKVKLITVDSYSTFVNKIYGNYIYFTKTATQAGASKFCRISLDGKNSKELVGGVYQVQIYNSKIYYLELNGTGPGVGSLYTMELNGTGKKQIKKGLTHFIITDKKILYTAAVLKENNIYSSSVREMSLTGTGVKNLTTLGSVELLGVTKEGVYYTANQKVHLYKHSTNQKVELAKLSGYIAYNSFRAKSNAVYFVDSAGDKSYLFSAKLDGSGQKVLYESQGDISYVDVADGKIFFSERSHSTNKIVTRYIKL